MSQGPSPDNPPEVKVTTDWLSSVINWLLRRFDKEGISSVFLLIFLIISCYVGKYVLDTVIPNHLSQINEGHKANLQTVKDIDDSHDKALDRMSIALEKSADKHDATVDKIINAFLEKKSLDNPLPN